LIPPFEKGREFDLFSLGITMDDCGSMKINNHTKRLEDKNVFNEID
jgi:hypothetical protein